MGNAFVKQMCETSVQYNRINRLTKSIKTMNRILITFMVLLCTLGSFAQSVTENINRPKARKPIIMVVPEKAWCINQGFVMIETPNRQTMRKLCSTMMCSM